MVRSITDENEGNENDGKSIRILFLLGEQKKKLDRQFESYARWSGACHNATRAELERFGEQQPRGRLVGMALDSR